MPLPIPIYQGTDDQRLRVIRRSVSGGINNRQEGSVIKDTQVTGLENVDINVDGSSKKRKGTTLLEDLGDNAGTGAFGFMPDGYANKLVVTHGTKLESLASPLSGTFTEHKTNYTSGKQFRFAMIFRSGVGDVLIAGNGTDNCFEYHPDTMTATDLGDTNTSPPKTQVLATFRNRLWALKSNLLYYSDAAPSDFSAAFDRTNNAYRVPVGSDRATSTDNERSGAIVPIRDMGLVILGKEQVWALAPSVVPAATDRPEKMLDIGCVAGKTAKLVGDDVLFLAPDGVRGVFRTQQDKLQLGVSFPLSYPIKDEVESVNWQYANLATAVWWQNRYLIAVPVDGSTYNNEVWVYYPAFQSWSVFTGWNVGDWAKIDINGEERLYYIDSNDGSVYRAFANVDQDNGTNFTFVEEGRREDLGLPLQKKNGGEIFIKAKATGSSSLSVYAEFDEGGYNNLGDLSLAGNLIDFTNWSFPMDFSDPNIVKGKFHIDSYGSWYNCRIKLENTSADDIEVLERSIVTYVEEYLDED